MCFLLSIVSYAALVSQDPGLDYITFNWNKMTATEFEEHWRASEKTKEADFIHMIQVRVAAVMPLTQILHLCSAGTSSVNLLSINRCCITSTTPRRRSDSSRVS